MFKMVKHHNFDNDQNHTKLVKSKNEKFAIIFKSKIVNAQLNDGRMETSFKYDMTFGVLQ